MKRPKHWTEDHVDYYRERVAIMMEGNEYRLEGPAPLDLLQMAFEDTELFFKEIWRDMAKHDKHGVRKRESENMKFDLFNDGIEEEEIKKPETLREAPEHETETEIETEKQTDQTKTEAPIEPQAPDSVESIKQAVARPTRPDTPQATLFDMAPDWKEIWWDMPAFDQKDARPTHKIGMNFMSYEDMQDFGKKLGITITPRTNSAWFPKQDVLGGEYKYTGPKTTTRYPVYIPSKGRADCQTLGKVLDEMGVLYKFCVEDKEEAIYRKHIGSDKVLVMPFHDLGKGSIPARNWIWNHAKENGHERHWVMDDNIRAFRRCHNNRRLLVMTGGMFRAIEDWCDRYENVAIAGPHNIGFVPDRTPNLTPILLNSRIYSCSLIKTDLPFTWRGRYNEDTDLCLRLLKAGYVTALFRALLMDKGATETMKGGNTDNVYVDGDRRKKFADSLQAQHPDVVEVTWKFDRWHHLVDYSPFINNALVLKEGVTKLKSTNEYGMKLTKVK